jgi:hypothetical protein
MTSPTSLRKKEGNNVASWSHHLLLSLHKSSRPRKTSHEEGSSAPTSSAAEEHAFCACSSIIFVASRKCACWDQLSRQKSADDPTGSADSMILLLQRRLHLPVTPRSCGTTSDQSPFPIPAGRSTSAHQLQLRKGYLAHETARVPS